MNDAERIKELEARVAELEKAVRTLQTLVPDCDDEGRPLIDNAWDEEGQP